MGVCVSKPAPQADVAKSTAVEQSKPQNSGVQEARQPAASPAQTQSIDILPAPPSVAPSVAILPPWVSHNDTDMGSRQFPSTAVSTANASNPAANALRSNLSEVKSVLQQLTAMNPNPTIGLAEAAEMLCKHLGVALVSIVACTEGLASYILLASYGSGAAELEKNVVMKGADWSPFLLDSHTNHIYYSVEADEQAEALPLDWNALYKSAGIKSFMAVPIGGAGEVLGLLTIAKHEAGAFNDEWWEPMLGVLAVGLYPQLRNEQVAYLCHLVRVLHNTQDYLALVALLLQGAHRLLLKTTNIKMGVRLGLLKQDHSRALVFEVDSGKMKETDYLTASTTRETMADITITEIGLENTLLLDAINKGKARFVSDCASYLQSCMKPATDIFISSQQMVASIVVLPLMYGDQNLGGLYFTLETPSNFQNIKDMLMGFVNSIVLVLLQKLEGRLHHMWDAVVQRPLAMNATSVAGVGSLDARDTSALQHQANAGASALAVDGHAQDGVAAAPAADGMGAPGGAGSYAAGGSLAADGEGAAAAMGLGGGAAAALAAAAGAAGGGSMAAQPMDGGGSVVVVGDNSTGNVNKKLFVKRSCTEAMLKVLQHEIRKTHARNQKVEWVDDLVLMETIGKGGFGVVYKGSWKGSLAAIKVMYARQHERQAMKDALEMAVLTTVSHPNIIQVYNCFTDMVEDAGTTPSASQPEGRINVRFRRLEPEEDRSLATCNIVVMEYCDKGSLRHAMKRGVFHKRLGSTSVAVDLCAIVQVLLEVAASVQHLHNMQLLHCDIKPENVLLKSDNSNPLGFTTKLSDFGLAKLLRDNYYIINRSGSGTVTHLAPELFQVGSKITTAVDTFSFGIMMWELYTGQRAYSGLGRDAIIDRVYKKQSRPVFPSGVPALYSNLARQCWESDVHLRPGFAQIRKELQEMLSAFQSGTYAGAGAAAEAVRERLQAAANPHNLLPHQLEQLQLQQLALQQQQHLQQQQAGMLAGSFAMQGIGGQQQMQLQQAQIRAQMLQQQQEQQQQQQLLLNPEVQQHFEQMKLLYQQEYGQQLLQQQQAAAQLQAQQAAAQQQQQQQEGQNGDVQQQQGSLAGMQQPLAQQLLQLQQQQQAQQQQQQQVGQDAKGAFGAQLNGQPQQHTAQRGTSAQQQPQQEVESKA